MIYFPSCNFTAADRATAARLDQYLTTRKGLSKAGCCRTDKTDYSNETGLYFCQACREVLSPKMNLENLYVYLAADPDFSWPDYSGLRVVIQDCWRDREHPEIMLAVRTMLTKMKIQWTETEESFEKTVFCGNLHFEPQRPENLALLAQYPDQGIWQMPADVQAQLMAEQADKFGDQKVITYCNRCTKMLQAAGTDVTHVLDLAFGMFGV